MEPNVQVEMPIPTVGPYMKKMFMRKEIFWHFIPTITFCLVVGSTIENGHVKTISSFGASSSH